MPKLYQYVGPVEIKERVTHAAAGPRIESVMDVAAWIRSTGQKPNAEGCVAVTFVIDEDGFLRVGDRGAEHIACSGGKPVLSAGEMFFLVTRDEPKVAEVSNQSTGFCPEPTSWPVVAEALDRIGIRHPGRFTHEIVFRRCPSCEERNIVKDGWYSCGVCSAELPAEWNF
jgi:hypothetical protein